MKKFSKLFFYNFVIFIILLIVLESFARFGIFILRGSSTIGLQSRNNNLKYQPFVMFGSNWEHKFKKIEKKPNNIKRILIIGGSTAQGWKPEVLKNTIEENSDLRVEVFNGAHGAYNIRQQLIVLSVWGKRIDPDIVISLDGANDILHSLRGENEEGTFYLNHTYTAYLTKPYMGSLYWILQNSQLYNGIIRLSRRYVKFNKEDHYGNVEIYLEAKKNISLVSKAFEASHISILQPYMGFKENKSETEKNFNIYDFRDKIVKDLFIYTEDKLNKDYSSFENTFHFSSQKLYDVERGIFSDDFHFIDDFGYKKLSYEVLNVIKKKNILN
tara:strand:- start:2940 stop:3923 length:984 start_codon:yes stop_codon:yes gene_type:complete